MNTYLKFNANGLESVVQEGNIISSINQSAEAVTINANKIDLSGDLSLKGEFFAQSSTYESLAAYIKNGDVGVIYGQHVLGEWSRVTYGTPTNYIGSRIELQSFDVNDNPGESSIFGALYSILNEVTIDNGLWVNSISNPSDICATFFGGVSFREVCYYTHEVHFYDNVYNTNGGIQFVSDKRKKKNIKDLAIEKARSFIMGLKPREYKFKKPISTSDRKHHGFIAQEVKEVMPEDFGIYVENVEKDFIGLRYDEFIADLVAVVQDQQKRIEELERRLDDITNNKS